MRPTTVAASLLPWGEAHVSATELNESLHALAAHLADAGVARLLVNSRDRFIGELSCHIDSLRHALTEMVAQAGVSNRASMQEASVTSTKLTSVQDPTQGPLSISVPAGMYRVDADAEFLATAEDAWQMPAQVRRFPDLPLATQTKGGFLGSIILSGPLSASAGDHIWAGYVKVLGANTQTPLMLRGRLALTKVA
ncbi:ImcF domain-containing protein (plasmid) [Burkholderia sp. YI23]|nr:ImcF domain-containing protein [Burkholderia sp. YI23]